MYAVSHSVYHWPLLLYIIIYIIGASLSEPHTSRVNGGSVYMYVWAIRRSVNAEVILIHESNSKNNLKHVVNMADSTSSTDQSELLQKRRKKDKREKPKLQKNVVYD